MAHTKRLIARNLRRLRLERELSQDDFAGEAGVRQALISALEVADANPTLETLVKIASALGVEVAALLATPTTEPRPERPAASGHRRAGRPRR